ncbi:MAG: ubiquinol-cytochrome c reductase iron-sulfur subunit [Legionellales bacterium RIFCSPHIGHO2_12_FULL_37_14]|nr:MAG: ubiquinol-cytochrome c reductase iron-sulfur subunit [Legionellales bacterium RIFCSPHIGHO2_12_FULL_37_14]
MDDLKAPSEDGKIDTERRDFLVKSITLVGGVGAFCASTPFLMSWWPSVKAEIAGGSVQVDISQLAEGQQLTVEWRGLPVWIIRRTQDMLDSLKKDSDLLRDPNSLVEQQPLFAKNIYRSLNPNYLVLIGICTHLGCVPKYVPAAHELAQDWPGGFFCPCHGSKFDLAGRVFKGVPAPINLEVPPYKFLDATTLLIGESEEV